MVLFRRCYLRCEPNAAMLPRSEGGCKRRRGLWRAAGVTALVAGALMFAGCGGSLYHGGYFPPQTGSAPLQRGQTSQQVIANFGAPTMVAQLPRRAFYYLAEEYEVSVNEDSELTDRVLVEVVFDAADKVASVRALGVADGVVVTPSQREARSLGMGNSLLEQMLSRFGAGLPGVSPNVSGVDGF